MAPEQASPAERFLALHRGDAPLVLPNPWDIGTARLLASLGFQALATTSSGFAATLGRRDGAVTVEEVVAHATSIAAATPLPVSVDFEHGFADAPADVARHVADLWGTGIAGFSIEDSTGRRDDPIYALGPATERIVAAAEVAHRGDVPLVLTARSESFLHGRADLADTIARLQAFQSAGADVLYAPGLVEAADIRAVVASVDRPVNVLALPGVPSVAELGALGVARVSVGGGFSLVAMAAVIGAARELLDEGTYGYWELGREGRAARAVFPDE